MSDTDTSGIVLTAQEAAALLKISMPTMYQLVHQSDFPVIKVGRGFRISRQALEEWVSKKAKARAAV